MPMLIVAIAGKNPVTPIAGLQALDGRGDETIGTLLPLISVARKLQLSSRTLVRTMMAIVIEKMAIKTAAFILSSLSQTLRHPQRPHRQ